ncbi:MAG: M12 family metallo-peptidase [Phycisphaerales bacterium]|nr:M12 family metallo-peptidase [Phycisphaerales bacterium]
MLSHLVLSIMASGGTPEMLPQLLEGDSRGQVIQLSLPSDSIEMQFERVRVLAPGVVPMVASASGERPADLGDLRMWRGKGADGARCFIGVSKWGVAGFLQHENDVHIISSGLFARSRGEVTSVDASSLPPSTFEVPECEVRTPPGWTPPIPRRGGGEDAPCRVATLAIETDWEYTERIFEGDPDAGATYAIVLAGAMTEIYTTELNVRFAVGFLRTWADDSDPYDPDSDVDMLDQFRSHWNAEMTHVERTVAHVLTGRTNLPYGGVAWLSVLCNESFGYAVSGYLQGWFPQPLEHNSGDNWDLLVMAHELGHNFGTLHTHDGFNPPLDNCGNGDCTGAENGTIMSYCHICPGGVSNIELGFREEVREVIFGYLEAIEGGCNLDAGAATAVDDDDWTIINTPISVDVLANDGAATCDDTEIAIDSWDDVSEAGGTVVLEPDGPGGRDVLVYTPPMDFIGLDAFTYTIPSGDVGQVEIEVLDLRDPDSHGALEPGLACAYYALTAPTMLPAFDDLDPYLNSTVPQVNFPSTDGAFASSGRSDEVGAVFEALIEVPLDGLYTFYTESNDGSKLYVGDLEVVSNDGVHSMIEESGLIGLAEGRHRVRVTFFEATGGAGLIVRWSGPGISKQIIPAAQWAHDVGATDCVEDVNGSGTIDVDDLLAVISSWGPCSGCAEDMDGDGQVGVDEILAILSVFGDDC